jgi:ABC-type nitrate/sulfonate/bicarbonate transport system ATPase subunit
MGPSGCGKTTLLNILSRRLTGSSVTGEQLLGGSPFDDATLRAMSTYVEQEDHLIGSLTVRETIDFAAKLALPSNVGSRERKERTEDMLREFGLVSVKDTKIGTPLQRGISGGQKRRVTTASQLITLPKIIFLGTSLINLINRQMSRLRVWTVLVPMKLFRVFAIQPRNTAYYPYLTLLTTDDRGCLDPSTIHKHPSPLRQRPSSL